MIAAIPATPATVKAMAITVEILGMPLPRMTEAHIECDE
jgi:hypothetical protein